MAELTGITVDVKVAIPDETILRCARLLEMWLDDNPNKTLIVDRVPYIDGDRHKIRIEERESYNGGAVRK